MPTICSIGGKSSAKCTPSKAPLRPSRSFTVLMRFMVPIMCWKGFCFLNPWRRRPPLMRNCCAESPKPPPIQRGHRASLGIFRRSWMSPVNRCGPGFLKPTGRTPWWCLALVLPAFRVTKGRTPPGSTELLLHSSISWVTACLGPAKTEPRRTSPSGCYGKFFSLPSRLVSRPVLSPSWSIPVNSTEYRCTPMPRF